MVEEVDDLDGNEADDDETDEEDDDESKRSIVKVLFVVWVWRWSCLDDEESSRKKEKRREIREGCLREMSE